MSRFDPLRSTSAERLVSGVLTNTTTTNAISSAYYANRLLDFRKRITAPKQNLRIPGVASEPSDIDVDLAWELIQEIEQAEKTRLQDLDEGQVSKYIVALSKAVGQRTRREYHISARTKRELVKKVMSRVMTLTPKDHDVLGNTDSIAEFNHGTIVTIKPKQGKKSSAKRRAWMESLPAGRPKKSHLAAPIKTKHDG